MIGKIPAKMQFLKYRSNVVSIVTPYCFQFLQLKITLNRLHVRLFLQQTVSFMGRKEENIADGEEEVRTPLCGVLIAVVPPCISVWFEWV